MYKLANKITVVLKHCYLVLTIYCGTTYYGTGLYIAVLHGFYVLKHYFYISNCSTCRITNYIAIAFISKLVKLANLSQAWQPSTNKDKMLYKTAMAPHCLGFQWWEVSREINHPNKDHTIVFVRNINIILIAKLQI